MSSSLSSLWCLAWRFRLVVSTISGHGHHHNGFYPSRDRRKTSWTSITAKSAPIVSSDSDPCDALSACYITETGAAQRLRATAEATTPCVRSSVPLHSRAKVTRLKSVYVALKSPTSDLPAKLVAIAARRCDSLNRTPPLLNWTTGHARASSRWRRAGKTGS